MTRLKTEDIKGIASGLNRYDTELFQRTGRTLRGIACHTFNIPEKTFQSIASSVEVGIIPFHSGQGIIRGFTETVGYIIKHLGFKVFITKKTDVSGVAEAVEKNAEVIVMADDQRFIALNIKSNRMSDNSIATAKGYVAGLDLMAGGLEGQKVLVVGCGTVGYNAVLAILHREAGVSVIDVNPNNSYKLAREIYNATRKKINIEPDLNMALQKHHLLVEATNSPGIIDAKYIRPYTHVAAPGMPLGLTSAAIEKISPRLLHDPLQIGTAVMAVDAVLSRSVEEWRVMLPYGAYIAEVTAPNSKKPIFESKSASQGPDHMGATKVSTPKSPPKGPILNTPSSPNQSKPGPSLSPPEELDEDVHEKTEQL
jgi:pyrrolysine biosynthesis protein PylD